MIQNKSENTVPNIWTAQENLIHFYKMVSLGLGFLVLIVLVFTAMAYFRDPIVVVKQGAVQEFYGAARQDIKVEKEDVESFTKNYLTALYRWSEFNPKKLAGEITPFSEEGLVPKVMASQTHKLGKLQDKKLSQDLAFVSVQILADRVTASFLRVLRIEGIPLVVPTELTLSLIEGARTRFNPMGIYVAGIMENERAQ